MSQVKFMVFFHQPDDTNQFESYYNAFLRLAEQIPDIQRRQVVHILGSPKGVSPYYRILELYFADKAIMNAALNSAKGQIAGYTLYERKPEGCYVETAFADVYEEGGGQTPSSPSQE
jgi:uncharacterized protein (TIGR02118 family)